MKVGYPLAVIAVEYKRTTAATLEHSTAPQNAKRQAMGNSNDMTVVILDHNVEMESCRALLELSL